MIGLIDNITSIIPQREPFVMIDQLVWYDEKFTRTGFLVHESNIFVGNGRLSESGLVENMAQTAAARAGYESILQNKPVRVGYIGAIKKLVIHSLPFVKDKLETEITLENQIFDVTLVTAKISCKGALIAACEMKIFISSSK